MTERRTYDHPSEIGKKKPAEVFQDCLDLHGEFIRHLQKTSQDDFDIICSYIFEHIEKNEKYFNHFDTGRFKMFLNDKARSGVKALGNYTPKEIPTDKQFEKIENKKEEKFTMNRDVPEKPKKEIKEEKPKKTSKTEEDITPLKQCTLKQCKCCEEFLPYSEFNRNRYGLLHTCKSCMSKKRSGGRKSKTETTKKKEETLNKGAETSKKSPETTRTCHNCSIEKGITEFRKCRGEDNRVNTCRQCEKDNRIQKERDRIASKEKEKKKMADIVDEETLVKMKTGKGLYFIAAILKNREDGEMWQMTDQINANSSEEAVGEFVLREEVSSHIIISVGFLKAKI